MRLDKRWYDFWERNPSSKPSRVASVYTYLTKRYGESHRGYHNLEHIEFCLAEFDRSRKLAANPMVVEVAIWFHDIIYDTHQHDNEAQSAELAANELRRLGCTDDYIQAVQRAIMATVHNGTIPASQIDEQLICDIDLSGLGQEWWEFMSDGINIREEYYWESEADFKEKRVKLLQMFHDRKPLYYLPHFQQRYELRAKYNLARALAELRA